MARPQNEIPQGFQSLEAWTDGSKSGEPDCKCLHVSAPPVLAIMSPFTCVQLVTIMSLHIPPAVFSQAAGVSEITFPFFKHVLN